jgi:DNA-binding LacI/PurR family transcriptional regulator
MAEPRYVPGNAARNLATRKTNTLGLVLINLLGDFFAPPLNGIESATTQAGYDLLVSLANRPEPREGFLRLLGPHNTAGLLVFADSLGDAGLDYYHEQVFPTVLIHRTPPDWMDIRCVTVENKTASRSIVEHLIRVHGRRRIVYLRRPEGQEDSR